jgi:predicted Zn-dependent peptidase
MNSSGKINFDKGAMKRFAAIFLLFTSAISGLSAQDLSPIPFSYTVTKLQNGLTVILAEDYSLPVVTVAVTYKVGSAYDPTDQPGMAYLMENLMFQGSQNIGRLQHVRLINQVGGRINALTTHSRTLFYETISSNQLPLAIWLESDRMNSLSLTASNVEESKQALISEFRRRQSTYPFQASSLLFERMLFPDFAYYHPVNGEESGIRNISLASAEKFYSTYYRPNNAVLCISGHFNSRETMRLIRKYFGSIPPGENIPPLPDANPPENKLETRVVDNTLVSTPGFHIGYPLTEIYSEDFYTLVLIDYIMLKGSSSRLRKRLVQRDKTALRLEGGIEIRDGFSAYTIFTTSNNEATKEMCKKALFSEINKLKSSLISQEELTRAKNLFKRQFFRRLESTQNRALFLTDAYIHHSGLDEFHLELEKYMDISATEIIGIMNRYFNDNYIMVEIKTK